MFEHLGLKVDSKVDELGTSSIGEALLTPHRSYLQAIYPLIAKGALKGIAHITGGGITDNLPRVLPEGTAARIERSAWEVPAIFRWLQQAGGVPEEDMLRTFNMGIGMILVCTPALVNAVLEDLLSPKETPTLLGRLSPAIVRLPTSETCMPRLGILISGRGSNLQAIIDAITAGPLRATIAIVISNIPGAQGLESRPRRRTRNRGDSARRIANATDYDRRLVEALQQHRVDLVCLAGFMRLLSPTFVDAFPNRILNIHPSLLPAFPGLDAQHQAFDHGVSVTGATVHFVNAELDAGPIVVQAAVPVLPDDTADTLSARILETEHRIYPEAIQRVLDGDWRLDGRRFVSTRKH